MKNSLIVVLKLLLLFIGLNIIRYFIIGPIEMQIVLGPLFGAMEQSPAYFNSNFTTIDWITSYTYNFLMWLGTVLAYHFMEASLNGRPIVKSLKVYALMWLLFASISAIYMNHYTHPKDFYIYSILDAALVFMLVGTANGFLYPLLIKRKQT